MGGYMFAVSCPGGKDYHERLKKVFPNLSSKIMVFLAEELNKAEINDIASRRLWTVIYPEYKKLLGWKDPYDYVPPVVVTMLAEKDIIITLEEAVMIRNKAENEYLDKYGSG